MDVLDKKMMIMAAGGLALTAVTVVSVGLIMYKQTKRIRNNMRCIGKGLYQFGSALQLLSGTDCEDDTECCETC